MTFQSNMFLVALELSSSIWFVGTRLPGAQKAACIGSARATLPRCSDACGGLQSHQPSSEHPEPIACSVEAGREGFWIHRLLTNHGIPTYVVELTSILVNRRANRAKTDRLDAERLLRVLAAYLDGDSQICSMVLVPPPAGLTNNILAVAKQYGRCHRCQR